MRQTHIIPKIIKTFGTRHGALPIGPENSEIMGILASPRSTNQSRTIGHGGALPVRVNATMNDNLTERKPAKLHLLCATRLTKEVTMKKLLIAGLIGLTATPAAVHANANVPGCQKTFWNLTWFGLSNFIGQCK